MNRHFWAGIAIAWNVVGSLHCLDRGWLHMAAMSALFAAVVLVAYVWRNMKEAK